jgi:hypothetical protein
MNALEMLLQRIQAPGSGPASQAGDMAWLERALQGGAALQQPALPEGLPDVVRQSILNQPSYGESSVIPGPYNPLLEQEMPARFGPQRDEQLRQGLNDVRNMGDEVQAIPEGWGLTSRPAGQSPFASPLNQLMQQGRRLPFALY